jgi:DNA-binding transcriptional MocR family regulator
MLKIERTRHDGAPIVDQLVEGIEALIESRRWPAGHKLPSIRAFAAEHAVSKSTVVDAFDRLVARGLLTSRHKVGFFVAGPRPVLDLAEKVPPDQRTIDPMWMLRQALSADPALLSPGCGHMAEDWLDDDGMRRTLRALARSPQANLLGYGPPLGFAPLRAHLAELFSLRGIVARPSQILLVDGAMHAIDLACRLLASPGDTVFVDDPGFYNYVAALGVHRLQVVGIPYGAGGPDLDVFAEQAARHRPRLYLTNATFHNPTGRMLSAATAHRLLNLAEQHGITIIEDDIYADFAEHEVTRLAALDQLDRVIYVGSFSKTLSAATRLGWIAARPDLIGPLNDIKMASFIAGNQLSAQIAYRLLVEGTYRKYGEGLRSRLRAASVEVLRNLERCGLGVDTIPPGGLFLWATLPEGIDSTPLAQAAAARGVALAPGNLFSLSRTAGRYLRFNIARSRDPRLWSVLGELMGRMARRAS